MASSGTPCPNTTTTIRKLVAPLDPYPFPTVVDSANKSTPLTLSGTAPHEKTVITAKDATTLTTTAPTPTLSASPSRSVWFPLLTATPLVRWHEGVQQRPFMLGTTQMIGGTMVRTQLTMTTTGRPNGIN